MNTHVNTNSNRQLCFIVFIVVLMTLERFVVDQYNYMFL